MGDLFTNSQLKNRPTEAARAVARLAASQHGVVTVAQLMSLGISRGSIQLRVETGRLHRVHRGVYSVGHELLTREGRYLAAVLACGPGAALSHRSAADLWGIRRCETRIEVTVARSRVGISRVEVHRSRLMHPQDFTLVARIRTTNPSRTLLDLASVLTAPELKRAVDRAERLELLDGDAIEELLERSGGRAGAKQLRRLLAGWRPSGTRSELERRFQELLEDAGVERPLVNVLAEGRADRHEVDCYWPEAGLIVELDGFAFHRTRRDRERDAAKDADLELAGKRVLRLSWDEVTKHEERSVERIRRLLVAPARPGPRALR